MRILSRGYQGIALGYDLGYNDTTKYRIQSGFTTVNTSGEKNSGEL